MVYEPGTRAIRGRARAQRSGAQRSGARTRMTPQNAD